MASNPDSNPAPDNLQPNLYAAILVNCILALIAISLRFLARRLVRASLWLDDWLALTSMVFAIGFDINSYFFTKSGLGLHLDSINRDVLQVYHDFFLGIWIGEVLYSFALAAAKLAILAFYYRIFRATSIKLPIKIIATLVICWLIMRVTVTVCHCLPVQGYWDRTIPANCSINDQKFFIGSVIPHLSMDVLIILLSVPYINTLQISWHQRCSVFGMFLFGFFVCFASIMQLIVCINLDLTSKDVTWIYSPIALWARVEVNLSVVAACLPSLRPIYFLIINGTVKSQNQSSQQSGSDYGSCNDKSNLNQASMFENSHSDSTQRFVRIEEGSNKSFIDTQINASSRGNEMACGLDGMALDQMHKDVIMVKDEIHIHISAPGEEEIEESRPPKPIADLAQTDIPSITPDTPTRT